MSIKWEDISSYTRGAERIPDTWKAQVGPFCVKVHRHVYHEPDDWLLTIDGLVRHELLAAKDIGQAKCQALAKLQCICEEVVTAITAPDKPSRKRKAGVPSRQQMYELLKKRSLELQGTAAQVAQLAADIAAREAAR